MEKSSHAIWVGFGVLCICLVFSVVGRRLHAAKGAPVAVLVKMNDQLVFEPDHVTIHSGDTVEWKNTSRLVHTLSSATLSREARERIKRHLQHLE